LETKLLVADDEKSITDILSYALRREGYVVEIAHDGEKAWELIQTFRPQVAILDVMMPKWSGYDVCRKIEPHMNLGIILLTAKNDIVDKVVGMELGADDYITKPFDIREVLVRVKSLLRRLSSSKSFRANEGNETIEISELIVRLSARNVTLFGKGIKLTVKEFDLLYLLVSNLERVFTRDELLELVWGIEYIGGTRTVDIHIRRLRQKLGLPYAGIINTIHGMGYKATAMGLKHET
jgi:two-component system alkaline phosphatase synthesis response regulator PhoP